MKRLLSTAALLWVKSSDRQFSWFLTWIRSNSSSGLDDISLYMDRFDALYEQGKMEHLMPTASQKHIVEDVPFTEWENSASFPRYSVNFAIASERLSKRSSLLFSGLFSAHVDKSENTSHYVDSVGFKEIPEFTKELSVSSEISTEKDAAREEVTEIPAETAAEHTAAENTMAAALVAI